GEHDEAYQILRRLIPEFLSDDARVRLFRLVLTRESAEAAVQRAHSLDLVGVARFPKLHEALRTIGPEFLDRVLPDLADQLLPDQLTALVHAVGDRLTSPVSAARLAEAWFVATGDAASAFS